jgi:LCP family protein required for cell wall assembly
MSNNKVEILRFIKKIKRPTKAQFILWGVGLTVAIALFLFVRNLTACWRLTSLPGVPPQNCALGDGSINPQTNPSGTNEPGVGIGTNSVGITPTVSAPLVELPPAWDGATRVTVLIMGLDYRDWEAGTGAPRSDTMMLLTIDPLTKTAGMLSIPRDMWVNIPDFGYNRINTAYSLGESWKLPGGGPGLAVKTVEEFLGVPIQYYAQVDFLTFERVIDEIGGVRVTPIQTVTIDALGDGDIPVTLEAGVTYALPGNLALAYARARHTKDGDVDRAKRQQDVIFGIRERVLNYWPKLVPKIYPLYQELSSGINMNMTLEDALRLALLAREISMADIKKGIIDYSMAVPITLTLPDGGGPADVLKPIPDQIRLLRDQIFTSGGALSPMASGDPTQLMLAEGSRVAILNGTYTEGVAGRTADYFKSQGMNVTLTDNSGDKVAVTVLVDHSGKPYLLKYLMAVMNIGPSQVRTRFDPNSTTDVDIIIGEDWAYNNPMP